jgi:hypothetical protein
MDNFITGRAQMGVSRLSVSLARELSGGISTLVVRSKPGG